MLDAEETVEIACGELRWEGARQHAGRTGNRENSLRRAALARSETAFKPWKWLARAQCRAVGAAFLELLARFFQDKCHHCDCLEKLWPQDWSNGPNGFKG